MPTSKHENSKTPVVLLVIANGSEEMETVISASVLRRGGCKVIIASISSEKLIIGAQKIEIQADHLFHEMSSSEINKADAIVLPGGTNGAKNLSGDNKLISLIKEFDSQKKIIAAICASPALVFGKHDIINGRRCTGYPSKTDSHLLGPKHDAKSRVVVDGNLITSQGPATAYEYAFAILEKLTSRENVDELKGHLIFAEPTVEKSHS